MAEDSWQVGNLDDDSKIYYHVDVTNYGYFDVGFPCVSDLRPLRTMLTAEEIPHFEGVALLTMISIPESMRRKGEASRIIQELQCRANRNALRFAMGPILDETGAMERIASKMNMKGVAPFTFIQE